MQTFVFVGGLQAYAGSVEVLLPALYARPLCRLSDLTSSAATIQQHQ
jgi:hypothetical protein